MCVQDFFCKKDDEISARLKRLQLLNVGAKVYDDGHATAAAVNL